MPTRRSAVSTSAWSTPGAGRPAASSTPTGLDDAAYRSMLRPALEVGRAAAPARHGQRRWAARLPHGPLGGRGDARPGAELGVPQRRARRGPIAGASSWRPRATSMWSSPASSTRRRWAASSRPGPRRRARPVAEVRSEHVAGIPLGRLGRADELADVVTFLCSRRASIRHRARPSGSTAAPSAASDRSRAGRTEPSRYAGAGSRRCGRSASSAARSGVAVGDGAATMAACSVPRRRSSLARCGASRSTRSRATAGRASRPGSVAGGLDQHAVEPRVECWKRRQAGRRRRLVRTCDDARMRSSCSSRPACGGEAGDEALERSRAPGTVRRPAVRTPSPPGRRGGASISTKPLGGERLQRLADRVAGHASSAASSVLRQALARRVATREDGRADRVLHRHRAAAGAQSERMRGSSRGCRPGSAIGRRRAAAAMTDPPCRHRPSSLPVDQRSLSIVYSMDQRSVDRCPPALDLGGVKWPSDSGWRAAALTHRPARRGMRQRWRRRRVGPRRPRAARQQRPRWRDHHRPRLRADQPRPAPRRRRRRARRQRQHLRDTAHPDAEGELQPGLATELPTQVDDTTWEFKLREGVTFHDGTPFNADAVVATVDRMVEPRGRGEDRQRRLLRHARPAPTKVDDTTVRITTAGARRRAAGAHVLAEDGRPRRGRGSRRPVRRAERHRPLHVRQLQRAGVSLELAANPDYWDGAPADQRR